MADKKLNSYMKKYLNSKESNVLLEMLYQLRTATGMKQSDLAKQLKINQSFISKIENGERRIDIFELRSILACYGTNLKEFVVELERRINDTKK